MGFIFLSQIQVVKVKQEKTVLVKIIMHDLFSKIHCTSSFATKDKAFG